jgi:CHAD domain-containing protein
MLLTAPNRAAMSRKSKWIEVDSPDEPAREVARRAVRARLLAVWSWFPDAAAADEENENAVESVHQLRVSTRRASAAVRLFAAMLPEKRRNWFEKRLKRTRRTAGVARDLDVLSARLREACQGDRSAGCGALLERVSAARRESQPAIRQLFHELEESNFEHRRKKLVKRIRSRSEDTAKLTYRRAAQMGLRPLAEAFFATSEADFGCILSLHEFRIAGKRLRYAMEVFAAAFGPAFREQIYPLIEELQEKLGAVNDHANAQNRYLQWLDETRDESQRLILGKLIAVETAALQASTSAFRDWWTPARAADLKARFWSEVSPSEIRCA